MIKALVVDDEPLVRERVRNLLKAHKDFQVVGECGDGISALEACCAATPDVVFLDIQMPGLTGLEVAETWRQEGHLPVIVFVTAYDQYALNAFRVNALDYLMKPIDPDGFNETLEKIRHAFSQKDRSDLEQRLQAMLVAHERQQRIKPHILVHEKDRYVLVRTADIHCIEATGNYSLIHCKDSHHILRGTLSALESKLDSEKFLRTHRSWIVNLSQVREAQPGTKGAWVLVTHSGLKVPVGSQYRDALDRVFG